MFCENCGTKLEDGALFCPECGAKMTEAEQPIPMPAVQEDDEKTVMVRVAPQGEGEDTVIPSQVATPYEQAPAYNPVQDQAASAPAQGTVFCPQCGSANNPQDSFCLSCGAPLNGSAPVPPVAPVSEQAAQNAGGFQTNDSGFVVQDINNMAAQKQKTPGKGKKVLKIVLIVVAALVVLLALVFVAKKIFGGSGNKKARTDILYIKDESLFSTSLKKIKPVELDDEAYNEDYYSPYEVDPVYTKDGKYVFYFQLDDSSYDLYYVNMKDKQPSPEKFASDIQYSYVLTDDNRVVYAKNNSLYVQDMKENKEKIANELGYFWKVSEDEKQVLWVDQEGTVYTRDLAMKEDKVKIDSDVEEIYFVSDDLYFIVYEKEDKLYVKAGEEEKEKIAQDEIEFVGAAVDGKNIQVAYGELKEDDVLTLYDLVDDSEKAAEGYDDYEVEWAREDLKNYEMGSKSALCVYDSASGEKSTVVEGLIQDVDYIGELEGKAATIYSVVEEENLPHWPIGKVIDEGVYTYSDEVRAEMEKASIYVSAGADVAEALEEGKMCDDYYADGKDVYLISYEGQWDEDHYNFETSDYELGKLTYGSKGFGAYEKVYSDASIICTVDDGTVIYGIYEDETEETIELYKNDKKVDTDVDPYSVALRDDGNITYLKDVDDEGMGTLKLYGGKESEKVANDVKRCVYVSEKMIPVLVDYDSEHGTGDLKLYNGKELESIDSDVRYIFYRK